MIDTTRFPSNPVDMYNRYGYAVLRVFDENQIRMLERFAKTWVYGLLAKWTVGKEDSLPLETYHIWSQSLKIDHGNTFRAQNRHMRPDQKVEKVLINNKVNDFLRKISVEDFEMWDEGLGWLAFRFIRPGVGDGSPLSRKAWGVAKNVVSCWVPIIGYSPSETLTLVPGSHLKYYEKYLPLNDKFTGGEYRLGKAYTDLELYNPKLEMGEAIFYHPKTLHSEDVVASNITRLNLEFRIDSLQPAAR